MSEWMSYEALLTEGYRQCAKLTWRYGTTYFWGATLLPKPQRKHVHAIYALCRLADDIVDLPNGHHLIKYDLDEVLPDPVEEHESSIVTRQMVLVLIQTPFLPSRSPHCLIPTRCAPASNGEHRDLRQARLALPSSEPDWRLSLTDSEPA